jgi:hypothetical protein
MREAGAKGRRPHEATHRIPERDPGIKSAPERLPEVNPAVNHEANHGANPRRQIQPWPFFFLATFLAAFFFFFAMEMAPYHEHPCMVLTSTPPDALGGERTTIRCGVNGDCSPSTTHR